jgi:hypothetical protein
MKICSKYNINKEYYEFSKCKNTKDGHQYNCKIIISETIRI